MKRKILSKELAEQEISIKLPIKYWIRIYDAIFTQRWWMWNSDKYGDRKSNAFQDTELTLLHIGILIEKELPKECFQSIRNPRQKE